MENCEAYTTLPALRHNQRHVVGLLAAAELLYIAENLIHNFSG